MQYSVQLKLFPAKICLFSLVFWAAAITNVWAQDLSAPIFSRGMQLYSMGDFNGAADYLDQVITMNPEHDQARYYLIFSLAQTGKNRKALQHARILAGRYPQQYEMLVRQLEQQQFAISPAGRHEPTAELPEPAVIVAAVNKPAKQEKVNELSELEKAVAMIDEENFASAAAALEKILAKSPRDSAATHYMGVIAFNRRDFAAAASQFEKAIAAGNRDFESRFLAGSSYLNLQQFDKAAVHFRKALEIKDDIFCRLNLAEIMMKTAKYPEAEKMYRQIQKSHPDIIDAQSALAQILFEQGYIDAASTAINEVLAEHPDNARARLVKARILMESKMYAEAAEEARLAFNANPGAAEYRACYALAMIRNFQVPQGIEQARAILQEQPDNIDAMLAIAEGLIVSGDSAGAEARLAEAEKVGPRPETSYLLANMAVAGGKSELARQYFQDYSKRSNGQPRALLDHARFLETVGDQIEAAKVYHQIISNHEQTSFAEEARAAVERLAHAESRPAEVATPRVPIPKL